MTHRERFFAVMDGRKTDRAVFFPDVTDWYGAVRTPPGVARRYGGGSFIPDHDPLHKYRGAMPAEFEGMTFLDFYRRFDWGLPIHGYGWYDVQYDGVEAKTAVAGNVRTRTLRCSRGELTQQYTMAGDGSWAPTMHFIKETGELEVMRYIVEHTRYVPRYDRLTKLMADIGEMGVCDVVLDRSPFCKLVHNMMGFEQVVYGLADHEDVMLEYLRFQEEKDLEVVRMAAAAPAPARIVILSDHADENLISPHFYRKYCIPFYQKATGILHAAGKIVSTHLDGNFKGYFPLLKETGFDLLDGCTPEPMMNYTVEELAAAMPAGMRCYCGVPATLFCRHLSDQVILDYGRRILDTFEGRAVLNIGDILPPDGDIRQVIRLGQMAQEFAV